MEWHNLYRGFLIGTSDLIPGVSGGTIAVMLGIYDQLLRAISGLFSRKWRQHVNFLLPLGIGMAGALLLLSRSINWLLHYHPNPTQFFFVGLIVGIVPTLFRETDVRHRFARKHYITMVVATCLAASLTLFSDGSEAAAITSLTPATTATLFGAGALASVAMLLPGISGSFVLLILGVYPTAIDALATLNIPVIAVIGLGVGVGFIASSKLISRLLERHYELTFAAIIGLIVGSVFVVFPGFTADSPLLSGLTFLAGLMAATRLGRRAD